MKLPNNRRIRAGTGLASQEQAFSRVDLLAVICVVLWLGGWFGLTHSGERGRIVRCQGNLATLSRAMQAYAGEHDNALPPAAIRVGKIQSSWDRKLFPYLVPEHAKANNDNFFKKLASPFLFCPADAAQHHGPPRSYAMGYNDMLPDHWPPGPDSPTGAGVRWTPETVAAVLGKQTPNQLENLPGVKLAAVVAPAETLLLTEFIDPGNLLGGFQNATVAGPSQQQQFFTNGTGRIHYERFNYLMMDGHVELLTALETRSFNGGSGIWSLKKEN